MSNVVPRGRFCTPAHVFRQMLSACPTVQALFQVTKADDAEDRIYLFEKQRPARPYIVVWPQRWEAREIGGGTRLVYRAAGVMACVIEFELARESIEVTSEVDATQFTAEELSDYGDDWFTGMVLEIESGPHAGSQAVVEDFDGETGELTVGEGLLAAPGVGTSFELAPADIEDAYLFSLNLLGDIRSELEGVSGGGGYLGLRNIRLDDKFGVTKDEKSSRQIFTAQLMADFG